MPQLPPDLAATVAHALAEDLGDGDISAALIPADQQAQAQIICRDPAVICGLEWVAEVFRQLSPDNPEAVELQWWVSDGESVRPEQLLCHLEGPARILLSGERTALNFLQTLSATATKARAYQNHIADTGAVLLDTRKTLPGLRNAQKYAVACGGAQNHRMGLYDAFLLKENHILAAGSISEAVALARRAAPGKPLEVEVENIDELQQALQAGADSVLLDNFDLDSLRIAVRLTQGRAKLEASGGVNFDTLHDIAETGVDYISVGALTKDVQAVDLSMRFEV